MNAIATAAPSSGIPSPLALAPQESPAADLAAASTLTVVESATHQGEPVAGGFHSSPKLPRPRKNLFGRADLAEVYHRARDLIVELNVFRMVQKDVRPDGTVSIVISNLWRLDKAPDGSVQTFEFDILTATWKEVSDFGGWPDIPMFPVQWTQSLDWWRNVARSAIYKVLNGAGYQSLPKHLKEKPPMPANLSWRERHDFLAKPIEDPDMSPAKMGSILVRYYLGEENSKDRKDARGGLLRNELGYQGARALRAALYEHVLDPALVSALMAINFRASVNLTEYLRFARSKPAILRIAKERRNLLPLVPYIAPKYRDRKDLFSRAIWVRDGRIRTLVDYQRFSGSKLTFESFPSRASFRWLCRAPLTVVKRWAKDGRKTMILENIVAANITAKLPAIAWCQLVSPRRSFTRLGVSEVAQRLLRTFAAHCEATWRQQGYVELKQWLRTRDGQLGDVVDWLLAEGIAGGHPERNATWSSLVRRSHEWHQRVAFTNVARNAQTNLTWQSLVPETTIDGIRFTPLNSGVDLATEGHAQHHCVGGYDHACASGGYRVYAVVDAEGKRSTLGLSVSRGRWGIDQHRGSCNGPIGDAAEKAGRALLRLYQAAHNTLEKDKADRLLATSDEGAAAC